MVARFGLLFLVGFVIIRAQDKSTYWKINFFISHPKHMLWVLKRTVSMRPSSLKPTKNVSTSDVKDHVKLYKRCFCKNPCCGHS